MTKELEELQRNKLPDLKVNLIELPYTPTKEYLQAEEGVINVPDYESTMTKLSAIQKLHQAVNGFLYLTDVVEEKREVYHIERNKKLDWLKENVPFGDKTVIVYRFAADVEAIKNEFSEAYYTDNVEEFKTDKNKYILLLQCSRCESFNLQMCNRIIFYTLDWNPSLEKQCIGRAARSGQTKTVMVYRLFYCNTVEDIMNDRILKKNQLGEVIVKGTEGDDEADIIKALNASPFSGKEGEWIGL